MLRKGSGLGVPIRLIGAKAQAIEQFSQLCFEALGFARANFQCDQITRISGGLTEPAGSSFQVSNGTQGFPESAKQIRLLQETLR